MAMAQRDIDIEPFQMSEIPLIFSDKKRGMIKIPYPLTKEEWQQMENILDAYKPSLIKELKSKKREKEHQEPKTEH